MARVTLRRIDAGDYVRLVLPQTAKLWAGRRDFRTYVEHALEVARSRYGNRHYRTFGLYDERSLVASFKRYERAARLDSSRLRAYGIGAVFTPPEYRGRGYASIMLGAALDDARESGYDFAFLFSDIAPQFYAPLGFGAVPSREFSLKADALPSRRLAPSALGDRDWSGVERCYAFGERHRTFGFTRTPATWEYIRMRLRQDAAISTGTPASFALRRGRRVVAYVLGKRVPERDSYVVDEFGYAGEESALAIPALLRAAAGDLRRVVGWLPPAGARDALPPGAIRKRKLAVFMAAPLTSNGRRFVAALRDSGKADPCWHADHV
jgi:predicted N-acetyltransferase YhbS